MNLLGKGGVKVTEAAREVAPWTGVPGGALSRQGEAEAVLNLLRPEKRKIENVIPWESVKNPSRGMKKNSPRRVEVLEHAVAEAMTAVG